MSSRNKLYFYRKTRPPEKCDYYNHAKGVAGFKFPQMNMELYLHGTYEELEEFLKNRKLVARMDDETKLVTNH